jgi:hypothetical protein
MREIFCDTSFIAAELPMSVERGDVSVLTREITAVERETFD